MKSILFINYQTEHLELKQEIKVSIFNEFVYPILHGYTRSDGSSIVRIRSDVSNFINNTNSY